ncbi:MAG: S-methyl-5'-thioadenosine phosphorylase [Myxococcales bacterium]
MIGIIGGSGLGEALGALPTGEAHRIDTPFGATSAPIVTTEIGGVPVALLARHGEGHLLNPSRVPYRANIFAMKKLGVTRILASGAVGSLREEIAPRSLVIPDQVVDRTYRRAGTFYEDLAVHVELASPFCPSLRRALLLAGPSADGGTYVCMEGPQFSTRAESELHRAWDAHLIGMTVMPEAKLAREAEICYALVALVTDHDCWRPRKADLDAHRLLEEIIGHLRAATENALGLIRRALPVVASGQGECGCQSALALAIWSDRAKIPREVRSKLAPLLGKYLD